MTPASDLEHGAVESVRYKRKQLQIPSIPHLRGGGLCPFPSVLALASLPLSLPHPQAGTGRGGLPGNSDIPGQILVRLLTWLLPDARLWAKSMDAPRASSSVLLNLSQGPQAGQALPKPERWGAAQRRPQDRASSPVQTVLARGYREPSAIWQTKAQRPRICAYFAVSNPCLCLHYCVFLHN